jgi:hypothetical protein
MKYISDNYDAPTQFMSYSRCKFLAAFMLMNLGAANAQVPPEIHKICVDAKDYQGCVNAQQSTKDIQKPTVNQDPYWFDESSVKRLRVNGKYGRYIVFRGRTIFNAYETEFGFGNFFGKAWNSNKSSQGSGFGSGYSISGTTRAGAFTYHLDCKEGTADRLGDASYAQEDTAGWFSVIKDPTAQAVFTKYCPVINDLPLDNSNK